MDSYPPTPRLPPGVVHPIRTFKVVPGVVALGHLGASWGIMGPLGWLDPKLQPKKLEFTQKNMFFSFVLPIKMEISMGILTQKKIMEDDFPIRNWSFLGSTLVFRGGNGATCLNILNSAHLGCLAKQCVWKWVNQWVFGASYFSQSWPHQRSSGSYSPKRGLKSARSIYFRYSHVAMGQNPGT